MRYLRTTLLLAAVGVPALACEVRTYEPPPYSAQVQVQTPPPPTAQVVVNQPTDTGAQPTDAQDVDGDPSAIDDFRNVLSPYGTWVDDAQYGTVWFPSPAIVGRDFTPYQTSGHWVYDNDYTWVSDYDWGWAPFHYGRWFVYPGHGWAWIPGKEYAGAWVTWRNGDEGYGYVGWAPTPPSFYYRGGQVIDITTPWYEPVYTYTATADLFVPSLRARIIRDPVRLRTISARTRPYAVRGGYVVGSGGARMRVRGPEPTRLGIRSNRIVRLPANARGVSRAQQFTRTRPQVTRPMGRPGVAGRPITPGHPPIERGNVGRPNPMQNRPMGNQQQRVEPGRGMTGGHEGYNQQRVSPQGRPEGRPEGRGGSHVVAPVPTPTTTNLRKPYPPPGTTHARGGERGGERGGGRRR
jgi:hypothetical protein